MSHDYGCTNHVGYDISCPHRDQDVCHPTDPATADGSACHIGPNNPWKESVPLYHGDAIIEQPVELTTLSDRYAEFAVQFVRNATSMTTTTTTTAAAGDGIGGGGTGRGRATAAAAAAAAAAAKQKPSPFFIYMPFNHMHVPVGNHRPEFTNTSDHGVYGDTLRQLDASLGTLFRGLAAAGVENDTVVLLTGDNGAPSDQCEFGGSNGPFQGRWLTATHGGGGTGKTTTWEGGHREPGLAVWPGHIAAGVRSGATASALDMVPTIAALAGAELPRDRVYDGVDLAPVLFGGASSVPRPDHGKGALFHPNSGCEGDQIGALETLRLRQYKAKKRTGGKCTSCDGKVAPDQVHEPPLLFDLHKDPGEAAPLDATTDPDYEAILAEVAAAFAAIEESIAADNTTVADYSNDEAGKPCCNPLHPLCECAGVASSLPKSPRIRYNKSV